MSESDHGGATIREVMALVETARRDVLAEVKALDVKLDAKLEAHYVRHETDDVAHESDHRREADRRLGYVRWAVTTVMTGIGTLFAIVWAVSHG